MLANLLAQAQSKSEFFEFMSSLDPDTVGAVMILTVIGVFAGGIAVSIAWIESRKSVKLAKIQREMIEDLVNRGYSPDDIQKLVRGQNGWDKLCNLFQGKTKSTANEEYRAVPPVKHTC